MSTAADWKRLNINLNVLTKDQQQTLNTWREQLFDMSWYIRKLNKFIARQANKEDKCTGKFWKGRFKSQALLDESALLSCFDVNIYHKKFFSILSKHHLATRQCPCFHEEHAQH